MALRVFEGFAGYGGAAFGLQKAGVPHQVIGFSEIDKWAVALYEQNHIGVPSFGDITEIKPEELPDFDLFTGGFPCQPFSSAGLGEGENDTRGTLFHDIVRVCHIKQPQFVLLENVKGLTTKRHASTLRTICDELERIGYRIAWKVLNSRHYGVPQNRERWWLFGTLDHSIDPSEIFDFPAKECPHLEQFLDVKPEAHLYRSPEQVAHLKIKHGVEFDVDRPCCLDIYNKKVRQDGISITITEPHHNSLRIVEPPRNGQDIVRKLSVTEHFRLMGFEDGEIDLSGFSYNQLCKRAGNGWDVNVARLLMANIWRLVQPLGEDLSQRQELEFS